MSQPAVRSLVRRRLSAVFASWSVSLLAALVFAACGGGSDPSLVDGGRFDGGNLVDARPSVDAPLANPDAAPAILENLLGALRANPMAAMQAQSDASGWPAPVMGGRLFVTTDTSMTHVAGDFDSWAGSALTADTGFNWIVLEASAGARYKFTNQTDYVADPWSRAYEWDSFGIMSMVAPTTAHRERFFNVSDGVVLARTVRVWVPAATATHVLYTHDGQNLFNPNANWGGWKLDETAPAAMMIVGIDNTSARISEYTHVSDTEGGGQAAAYAAFVQNTVREIVAGHYGEPAIVGTMGSSLGGLVSLYLAHAYPNQYAFVASLSGTLGWGSRGMGFTNQTIIQLYQGAGHRATKLYIDSGGSGTTCADSDMDGTNDDDPTALDNYCTNLQMRDVLAGLGYVQDTDLWHWHEPGAPHNEAAWAARVFRPLAIFAGL